jgi:hypothetical protein
MRTLLTVIGALAFVSAIVMFWPIIFGVVIMALMGFMMLFVGLIALFIQMLPVLVFLVIFWMILTIIFD